MRNTCIAVYTKFPSILSANGCRMKFSCTLSLLQNISTRLELNLSGGNVINTSIAVYIKLMHSPLFSLCAIGNVTICHMIYVTQSGKTGLIVYLKLSRNAGFKYLVCCSSPMVEVMCTKFSHVLHQFLTFHNIHCASSQRLSFPPF